MNTVLLIPHLFWNLSLSPFPMAMCQVFVCVALSLALLFSCLICDSVLITEDLNPIRAHPPASFYVFQIVLVIPRWLSAFRNPVNVLTNSCKWNLSMYVFLALNPLSLLCIHIFFYILQKSFWVFHIILLALFDTVVFVAVVFFLLDFYLFFFIVSDLSVSSYPAPR